MNQYIGLWLFCRLLRWAGWLGLFAFSLYYLSDRRPHINSFGQLLPQTEFILFGTALVAVFAGFLEMAAREKAGYPRPAMGRNWLG